MKLPRLVGAALLGLSLAGAALPVLTAQTEANAASQTTGTAPATIQAAPAAQQPVQSDSPEGAALGLTLSHPKWEYKDAAFFKRISEYFTGNENTGYRLVLRTDPRHRGGLYFQVLLSHPVGQLPEGAYIQVRFIEPDTLYRITQYFILPQKADNADKTQLWIGFTGEEIPKDKTAPVAWQMRIVDLEGNELAETHSFLWSERDAARQ